MKKMFGAGLLALASSLSLAGCNVVSNTANTSSNPTGPTLDTTVSTAGLSLANTAGGGAVLGQVYFDNASTIGIASGGNPDDLQTFQITSPTTGAISFAPVAGQLPGIYPVQVNAVDGSGNLSSVYFIAYVYASTNGTDNATAPLVINVPASSLGTGGDATISLGVHNGFDSITGQNVTLTPIAGSASKVNGDIELTTNVVATPISNTDTATLTTGILVPLGGAPVAGAGSTGCINGMLMVLTAQPYYDSLTPAPFQEDICINLT